MATPKTGNPRGAPKKDFLKDPDRHLIAAAMHLQKTMAGNKHSCSERQAFALAIGILQEKVHRRITYANDSGVKIAIGETNEKVPQQISYKISRYYKKFDRLQKRTLSEEEKIWFDTMDRIFTIGKVEAKDEALATELMRLASSINEFEWVQKWLAPNLQ